MNFTAGSSRVEQPEAAGYGREVSRDATDRPRLHPRWSRCLTSGRLVKGSTPSPLIMSSTLEFVVGAGYQFDCEDDFPRLAEGYFGQIGLIFKTN